MTTKIIIACPVYRRSWVLPLWFEAIEKQTIPLSDIGFMFELGPDDDETHELLWQWHDKHPEVSVFYAHVFNDIEHQVNPEAGRKWNQDRYAKLSMLRNSLLDVVTCHSPERYFSLDSDLILENPNTLEYLYELSETRDIVSPLSYMKYNDTNYPSAMFWIDEVGGRARRDPGRCSIGELFPADIVMAAVMMKPEVYSKIRYAPHRQGEDLGFAGNAGLAGFKAFCASNHYAAHIMHEHVLQEYLEKGDIRSTNEEKSFIPSLI